MVVLQTLFKKDPYFMTIEIRKEYKAVCTRGNPNSDKIFEIRNNYKTLYQPRRIESLYMDTIDFKLYKMSNFMDTRKFKFRYRQYNNSSKIKKEIKLNTQLGRKKLIEDTKFLDLDDIKPTTYNSYSLVPIVKISFLREYYFTKNLRITIDTDLKAKLSTYIDLNESEYISAKEIIEFKLNETNYYENILNKILINNEISIEDHIPFTTESFSKYTHAIENLINVSEH